MRRRRTWPWAAMTAVQMGCAADAVAVPDAQGVDVATAYDDAATSFDGPTAPRDAVARDAAPNDVGLPPALDVARADVAAVDVREPSADVAAPPVDGGGRWTRVDCSGGGQLSESVGAENPFGEAVVGLSRAAMGCPSTWTLHAPPAGYRMMGTPNQKLLWRVWYYGWAQRAGTASEIEDARSFLLAHFETQLRDGHQSLGGANELLTTSHYQIWANGMTCARVLAVHYADARLLAATQRWWRGEIALMGVLQRGASIDAPGTRFMVGGAGGASDLRDTVYAQVMGLALPGRAAMPRAAWWDQYYNVAAWTLRNLLRAGDDLGGARGAGDADLPLLSDDLSVRTRGSDFVFAFDRLRGGADAIFWVARIGGAVTRGPVIAGAPGESPGPSPPALAGATVRVLRGRP